MTALWGQTPGATIFEAEHEAYRSSVRSLIEREVVPHHEQWSAAGATPRELFRTLGDVGAFAAVPEEFGGSGLADFRYNLVLIEEAARAGVSPSVVGATVHADVCLPYLVELGTPEQQERWLPGVASGDLICAIGMTEPGTGSDLSGIRTSAVRVGEEWVVNGAKTFISNGINADLVVTAVRTGPHPHRGLSMMVIERGTPGFERGRNLDKLGMHAQDTAELSFRDARVPLTHLLGPEGEGFAIMSRNLPQERVSVAAAALATAARAIEWTMDYVRERTAFGSPIGAFQKTRFDLATLVTEVEVTRAYLDRCVLLLNAGALDAVAAAKLKWWATEVQGRVVDRCLQLHGGYGYMNEYPIARIFADSRVSRIYGGTTEVMAEIVGRSLALSGSPR